MNNNYNESNVEVVTCFGRKTIGHPKGDGAIQK